MQKVIQHTDIAVSTVVGSEYGWCVQQVGHMLLDLQQPLIKIALFQTSHNNNNYNRVSGFLSYP